MDKEKHDNKIRKVFKIYRYIAIPLFLIDILFELSGIYSHISYGVLFRSMGLLLVIIYFILRYLSK